MIDERHLQRLKLARRSRGQILVGTFFLIPNYNLPPKAEIVLEGVEHIPADRPVIFAMNHTDRYNYWPFQYKMWRRGGLRFTTTWVKGKYYENKLLGWFFDKCNNIPLPSRGYLIFQDARAHLGRTLGDEEYRILRDLVDGNRVQTELDRAELPEGVRRLLDEPRGEFDAAEETYAAYMDRWFARLMELVERRTLEALYELDNNLIVFPQGTRSIRLRRGLTGLAQFALRHDVPVVPVGSMGSESLYPGSSPWASGGRAVYRIGQPMTTDDAFADCRIDEPYTPFVRDAERFQPQFERATDKITLAINNLLDEPYKLAEDEAVDEDRPRSDRFL